MSDKTIVNIGTPEGKTAKIILEGEQRTALFGYNVGDTIEGNLISDDMDGYKFKIMGGSNDDGVAMRHDLPGPGRAKLLLRAGVGFNPKKRGERRRKLIRGAEIQDDISQLNIKVIEKGKKPLAV